jgi:hypothetical protein
MHAVVGQQATVLPVISIPGFEVFLFKSRTHHAILTMISRFDILIFSRISAENKAWTTRVQSRSKIKRRGLGSR